MPGPKFDVKTPAGLKALNGFLSSKSYMSGYAVSDADFELLAQFTTAQVDSTEYPHVARWFSHILSFPRTTVAVPAASSSAAAPAAAAAPKAEKKAEAKKEESDDDDGGFSLDDDDEEDADAMADRIAARYKPKVDDKPKPKGKSSLLLDVKPEEAETDMAEVEKNVRAITMDGLHWGAAELKPVAFGVKKLRIMATIVDEDVSVDDLQEMIESIEGVQSMDIFAFNKL